MSFPWVRYTRYLSNYPCTVNVAPGRHTYLHDSWQPLLTVSMQLEVAVSSYSLAVSISTATAD
jgi:hypothetical protein